jgi:2-oxoglutarate ferredoxin oxidoreductase subunit alpha
MSNSHILRPGHYYFQGNEACIEGAIMAGSRVYAGYPITPATEVMEAAARRFPQVGGRFIQMEDEISSACLLIGASWGGAKALTGTSSPGFSLMQEAISFGIMSETPFVIIDVQRPGPGQGYITAAQEDVMQARWGHHGEGSLIALAPNSVQEMFDFTILAFNYAEQWRTPVILLADETVGHMREKLKIPHLGEIHIVNRKKPQEMNIRPEDYLPFGGSEVPLMANWGEGYNVNVVGLVHQPDGHVTRYSPELNYQCIDRKLRKIEDNVDKIAKIDARFMADIEHLIICYGTPSRTALEAVTEAREDKRIPIGYLRLITLWPFPEEMLRKLIPQVDTIFVPEMNLGMMMHPIREALRDKVKRFVAIPSMGTLHSPDLILSKIYGELRQ